MITQATIDLFIKKEVNLMQTQATTDKDWAMAQRCVECPVCTQPRGKQEGNEHPLWFKAKM